MAKTAGAASAIADLPLVGTAIIPPQTVTAGNVATVAVSFGVTFPAVPQVMVNINSGAGFAVRLTPRAINVSTTGFTACVFNVDTASSVITSALTLGWIASI